MTKKHKYKANLRISFYDRLEEFKIDGIEVNAKNQEDAELTIIDWFYSNVSLDIENLTKED